MANYEYTGCVTGFSEAGNIQLIQPTETLMPVNRTSNAYTERLLGIGLLLSGDEGAGGGQLNTVNFLKLQNDEQINGNDGIISGLVYSVNGGEIQAVKEALSVITEGDLGAPLGHSFTMYAFLPELEAGEPFLSLGRDGGFGWDDTDMPNGLDVDNFYLFGLNNVALQEFLAIEGITQPEEVVQGEVVLTVYPASKLPAANIDYDIFDLIIDPSNYTASEIAHFAAQGISPAIKNLDGSYTIKSQLTLPPFETPTEF